MESANLQLLNGTLESTAVSLASISENLAVLAANTRNANDLAKIYTDIHDHNRRLSKVISEPTEVITNVESHIETLNKKIADLKHQLSSLN
ncbi:hypothetical protein CANINC_001439 [Pichia inconspicua]|uniref:Uncharacterized protein n=1 Tax=Pichia inconspicua TaxID=52247 RepID=A0A4T0X3K4_9ASCO|nr:hypothetical protein CANINC_001439 [[Candida] inconspicua]